MATTAANQATELDVCFHKDGIRVNLPRIGMDPHYMETLEELMKLNDLYGPAVWEIDLSNQDGIPLALASVLLGFGNDARRVGGEVRFTGVSEHLVPAFRKKQWARCFGVVASRDEKNCEVTLQSF
jgi:hypothetical protein